jgi:carbon storage regulator CsrA
MLVLAQKVNRKFVVYLDGQQILEIAVTELRGKTVRLGFVAPPEVKIWREEKDPHQRQPKGNAA